MALPKTPFGKSSSSPGLGDVLLSALPPNKQALTTFTFQYPLKLIAPDPHTITTASPVTLAAAKTVITGSRTPAVPSIIATPSIIVTPSITTGEDGTSYFSHVPESQQLKQKLEKEKEKASQLSSTTETSVTTVFLLTYGGGLLSGDKINLRIELAPLTRMILLTQGSTKIFKAPSRIAHPTVTSRQNLDVKISPGASLCYLPDPTQPFGQSVYEQRQTFYVDSHGTSNLIVLDWVSEGRRARGESWTLWSWNGRNEVREFDERARGRLLLRDATNLHQDDDYVPPNAEVENSNGDDASNTTTKNIGKANGKIENSDGNPATSGLAARTNNLGILGTLIIYGPMLKRLSDFFMKEFAQQPRLGAKRWTDQAKAKQKPTPTMTLMTTAKIKTPTISESVEETKPSTGGYVSGSSSNSGADNADDERAKFQHRQTLGQDVTWTAASSRDFVIVKFGAKEIDDARRWLGRMLRDEGTVEKEFGHQALFCLNST